MNSTPLFWTQEFSELIGCNQVEVLSSAGRQFVVNFQISDQQILIPGRATFGGFFPKDGMAIPLSSFDEIFEKFKSDFVFERQLIWKFPPDYFYPEVFKSQRGICHPSAYKEVLDYNQHIGVATWGFEMLSKGNRKKYKQAAGAGTSYMAGTVEDISKCFKVLSENRAAIGVQVSMSEIEMKEGLLKFPDAYRIHFLELEGEVAAMCLTVDIAPRIRYVLYWADNVKFRNLSPTVFLFVNLVELSKANRIEILDLGISSLQGTLNEGLFRFKQNLGSIETFKRTHMYWH